MYTRTIIPSYNVKYKPKMRSFCDRDSSNLHRYVLINEQLVNSYATSMFYHFKCINCIRPVIVLTDRDWHIHLIPQASVYIKETNYVK